MELWYNEQFEDQSLALGSRTSFRVDKVLYSGQSKYQKLDILRTTDFGNLMLLDNIIMLTEKNEFAYHEMLAHVPINAHPNPKRVLIIGGGDGGTAREVLKNEAVEECVMVEIDELVVEKAKEFFPKTAISFKNPKLDLKIADGIKYMKDHQNYFDVILIDSTDPFGPAEGLFEKEFYQDVYNALKEDGIAAAQAESPYYYPKIQKKYFSMLKELFPKVTSYMAMIPFYPSGAWSFSFASKKYSPFEKYQTEAINNLEKETEYFNSQIFKACFALPNFAKKNLENYS